MSHAQPAFLFSQKFNLMIDITMKLNELNLKLQVKGNMSCWKKWFVSKKSLIFVENMESGKLLNFKNLKQYRDETNATFGTNYFRTAIKKNAKLIRWVIRTIQNKQKDSRVHTKSSQHKYKWDQHWTICNWCWSASNAIAGFEKKKPVEWEVHRTQEHVRRVGGPEMHAPRAAQVGSEKFHELSLSYSMCRIAFQNTTMRWRNWHLQCWRSPGRHIRSSKRSLARI